MKHNKVLRSLALGIIPFLLLTVLSVMPSYAASGRIKLYPNEGRIGDTIEIDGTGFDANEQALIYFSNDRADVGDEIDKKVTAVQPLLILMVISRPATSSRCPMNSPMVKIGKICTVVTTTFMLSIAVAKK